MGKAKFKVTKNFIYEGKSYDKGTFLKEIYSKVNVFVLHFNIENIGWVNSKNPIMNNLERIV